MEYKDSQVSAELSNATARDLPAGCAHSFLASAHVTVGGSRLLRCRLCGIVALVPQISGPDPSAMTGEELRLAVVALRALRRTSLLRTNYGRISADAIAAADTEAARALEDYEAESGDVW